MRTLLILSAGVALVGGGVADAQVAMGRRVGAGYPVPGRAPMMQHPGARPPIVQHPGPRPAMGVPGQRWGSRVGGRWWGGANAPGGWNAYRRPVRGYALPSYWVAPRFYIGDWQAYGLRQPAAGYNWVRYYDDAVLIDQRGSVYDTVDGLDWDGVYGGGYDDGYGDDRGQAYGDDRAYRDDRVYRDDRRRDSGLGGAAVGAVAGGVAGNLIAGRGNRLGGTLIGAGVGAATGYAIDRSNDGPRRVPVAPEYDRRGVGAGYPPPVYDPGFTPPPPAYRGHDGAGGWVSPDGRTTVTTTSGGYHGGSTTTVVVQSAPVVTTTTTTEIIEDNVTWSHPVVRKAKVRRWKAAPRCACR